MLRKRYEAVWREGNVPVNVPASVSEAVADTAAGSSASEVAYDGAISASGLSWEGIKELLQGHAPWYRHESIRCFVKTAFSGSSFLLGNISVSYIDLFVIFLIIIGILYYCGFLELMYLFAFSLYEATHWSSSERYLGSYIGGVFIALLCCILCYAKRCEKMGGGKAKNGVPLLVLAFILMAAPMEGFIIRNSATEVTEDMVYGVEQTEEALRSFSRRGEKIYYVCNNSSGYSYYIFKVTACPLQLAQSSSNFLGSKESVAAQTDIYEADDIEIRGIPEVMDAETWRNELQDYDYVFIEHPAELFAKDYSGLFEEPESIDAGTFYEVVKQDGDLLLHYIGKVGVKAWK